MGVSFCLWFSEEPSPCSWNGPPRPSKQLKPLHLCAREPDPPLILHSDHRRALVPLLSLAPMWHSHPWMKGWGQRPRKGVEWVLRDLQPWGADRQMDSVESHPRASHMSRWGMKSCSKSSSRTKSQINPMEATPLPLGIHVRWRLLREWMNAWTFVLNH